MDLQQREGDGATLRQHLQRLHANTGRVDPRLVAEIPPAGQQLWDTYLQLDASRQSGMSAQPITLHDLDAWGRLYGVRMTPWELDTLIQLDKAALARAAEARTKD